MARIKIEKWQRQYFATLLGSEEARLLIGHIQVGRPIVVTGVPASGKTTLVKVLRDMGCHVYDATCEVGMVNLDRQLTHIVRDYNPKTQIMENDLRY